MRFIAAEHRRHVSPLRDSPWLCPSSLPYDFPMGRSKESTGSKISHKGSGKNVTGVRSRDKELKDDVTGSSATHIEPSNRVHTASPTHMQSRNELDGSRVTRNRRPVTFGKVADDFLKAQKERLAPSTLIRLQSMLKRFNAFFRDSTNIALISEEDVRRFVRQRRHETSTGSLSLEVGALKQLFRMGVENGLIRLNPAAKVIVRREKVETRYLNYDDFWKVFDLCPEWLKPLVALSVGTGMRRQELLRLRWEDVDEEKEEIRVHRSRRSGARQIPLNDLSKRALEMARPPITYPTARIFNGRSGNSAVVSMAFLRACRASGAPHVSFKDLRHTSAKFMAERGVPIAGISAYLGHSNARTAVRYLDDKGVLSEAAKAIDFVFNRSKLPIGTRR